MAGRLRYSVSLVTQGDHRFYTLTMPSDVLGRTCFVVHRLEDPKLGFQRLLDEGRAKQIAEYIDSGFGTIPTSIVLSAQKDADFKIIGRGKTVEFNDTSKAFLILDGQHRVYGFSLAQKILRVPVVIYNGLSRQDETRLFIDINTKQKAVPNELLLDIRKLADYQDDVETMLGEVFDFFNTDPSSPLLGLMNPAQRRADKISRVTFNRAVKPLLDVFREQSSGEIYMILSAYLSAFLRVLSIHGIEGNIVKPFLFRAVASLFPEIAQRVVDRFGKKYSVENFTEVLAPIEKMKRIQFAGGIKAEALHKAMLKSLKSEFSV